MSPNIPCTWVAAFLLGGATFADPVVLHPLRPPGLPEVVLPLTVSNQSQITGMQFDLLYPATQATPRLASVTGTSDHRASSRDLGGGRQRVVIWSPSSGLLPTDFEVQLPLGTTTTAPEGGPDLEVTSIILATRLGGTVSAQLSYAPIEAWRKQYFTTAERLDDALVGDSADPDGDGVTNLAEYATGQDPRQREAGPHPLTLSVNPAGSVLSLTWHQNKTTTGLSVTPQTTRILKDWTTSGITTAPTGQETSTTTEMRASVTDPSVGDGGRFLRLRIQRKP